MAAEIPDDAGTQADASFKRRSDAGLEAELGEIRLRGLLDSFFEIAPSG